MSKFPPVTRTDHRSFCETEGWDPVINARGRPVGHHSTYTLRLGDGRILRTRISRPIKPEPYSAGMASHILREQLEVTESEFWECVNDKQLPVRTSSDVPQDTIPASIIKILSHELGYDDAALKKLSRAQAIELVNNHWSKQE